MGGPQKSNLVKGKLVKIVLWIISSLGLISSSYSQQTDKYISKLPDSLLINEVIASVIHLDSLRSAYKMRRNLIVPDLFELKKDVNDSNLQEIPQPGTISYDELYNYFTNPGEPNNKKDDSIFIQLQVDRPIRFFLSNELLGKFDQRSESGYSFYLPIFSFDQQFVFIQYLFSCGPLCGSCHQILLKRKDSKWVLVDSWACGTI
jgi:hypothetical protein